MFRPDPYGFNVKEIGAAAVDTVTGLMQNNEFGIPPFQKLVLIPGKYVDGTTLRTRS